MISVLPTRPQPEPTEWGPARCLMAAAALAAFVGMPLGLLLGYWSGTGQMAAVPWVGLVQAHGQVQLFGWLGLSILGVTFHAMAHLFRAPEPPARLAAIVLVLQVLGIALRVAAPLLPPDSDRVAGWLLVGSAVALVGAFAITLEAHLRTMSRRSRERRGPAVLPRFLLTGLLLWFVSLLVNLDGAIDVVRNGAPTPAALGAISPARDAFIVAAVGYGLALVAAGMSLRVVVGWLDLPAPDLRRAEQAWWPLAAAALARAIRPLLATFAPDAAGVLDGLGATLWAIGVVWYLPVLRGLWSPGAVRAGGGARGEADPPLAWFVRTAYAWLAVSGVLALAEAVLVLAGAFGFALSGQSAVADAGRHALLFGYLGILTSGLAGRLPTAFLDVGDTPIAATRVAYRAAWLTLLAASLFRVAAPLSGDFRTAAFVISGTLGTIGLCSLLLVFARIALAAHQRDRALRRRARRHSDPQAGRDLALAPSPPRHRGGQFVVAPDWIALPSGPSSNLGGQFSVSPYAPPGRGLG